MGFYGTTLVLICVPWHKSRSETCQKLEISESFDMVGWDIIYDFIFLTQSNQLLTIWPQTYCFHGDSSIQTGLKFQ